MIKKAHKIRHNRRLSKLWFKIFLNRACERIKDYDIHFAGGNILFVKRR